MKIIKPTSKRSSSSGSNLKTAYYKSEANQSGADSGMVAPLDEHLGEHASAQTDRQGIRLGSRKKRFNGKPSERADETFAVPISEVVEDLKSSGLERSDKETYKKEKPKKEVSVIHKSIELLARREHSVFELKQKLKRRDYSDMDIRQAIDRLLEDDLICDERFTQAYVRHRAMRGFGPSKIAMELRNKGVDALLLEEYVDALSPVWIERAKESYTKKFGNAAPKDYSEWSKRARFLQGRGFTSSIIQNVCPAVDYH